MTSVILREDAQLLLQVTTMLGKLLLEYGAKYTARKTQYSGWPSRQKRTRSGRFGNTGLDFVSFHMGNESHTKMRRVRTATIDLSKVTRLNDLSRRMTSGQMTMEEAESALLAIQREKESAPLLPVAGGLIGAMAFTLILGASVGDTICAGLAAVCMLAAQRIGERFHVTFLWTPDRVGSEFGRRPGHVPAGPGENFNLAIVGSIMLLFPGISITNSMRDALSGDFISGLTHGMQALATALAIAIGVGTILLIMQGVPA